MPFHSPAFFLLCLLTLALYYLGRTRWQHAVLLLASLSFYYYAGLVDTILLVAVVSANFFFAQWSARSGAGRRALTLAVVVNLGVLASFKYRRLAVEGVNHLFGMDLGLPTVVIPLGISFYIFQLIAYQVDLVRGQVAVERSFARMMLYILFFPHHQAGPIMRPAKFLPQFHGEKRFDAELVAAGGLWILFGLVKKVLADNIAPLVEPGFSSPDTITTAAAAWQVALLYTSQIYLDFSGYSDIAVGLGNLFGYQLDRNFDQPYLARSPSELWQRWHVTLSAWLRDYLYVPLGGNRRGPLRTYVNLMLTMVLGGLWHGASVMFLLWGAIHGALLVVGRRFPRPFQIPGLGWAITFVATVAAWVPFRAPTWAIAAHLLRTMFGAGAWGGPRAWRMVALLGAAVVVAQLAEDLVLHTARRRVRAAALWTRVPAPVRGTLLAVAITGLMLGLVDHTTYIYFRF